MCHKESVKRFWLFNVPYFLLHRYKTASVIFPVSLRRSILVCEENKVNSYFNHPDFIIAPSQLWMSTNRREIVNSGKVIEKVKLVFECFFSF